MKSVTIMLPESITESEARLSLAIQLFEEEKLSCGKAAEVAGCSKHEFMRLLSHRGIAVVDYPADELAKDLEHARGADGQ